MISASALVFLFYWFIILKFNYPFIKYFTTVIFIIYLISYVYLVLANPGIPERDYYKKNIKISNDEKKDYRKCSKCNIIIPKKLKVVHCQKCEICVKQQDHHCPWSSKCIGGNNLTIFHLFCSSLCAYLIFLFISFITCIIHVSNKK